MSRLTGIDAIEYATANGMTLCKYADPTEDARTGLTTDEAREIAHEDPSLIYIDVAAGKCARCGEARELYSGAVRDDGTHYERTDGSFGANDVHLCVDCMGDWLEEKN